MGFYTAICTNLLFPLHERLKHHDSVALRRQLEDSQWWSADRLAQYRVQRLRTFLGQIGRTVPYYRDLFAREGFDPDRVDALESLQGLPFLTKSIIRANVEQLKAEGHGPLSRYNTGGSSVNR